MSYLFLDTSSFLVAGILSEKFEWSDYAQTDVVKSSGYVHGLLNDLLIRNNLSWNNLKGLIVSSGPGSYTGMRVSEGIAQVLEIDNLPIFSFYHFEALKMLDRQGVWVSEAFKGEYFFFESQTEISELLSLEELVLRISERDDVYALNNEVRGVDYTFQSTLALLKDHSSVIFSDIVKNEIRREPFYYRPENVEFALKPKKVK